MVLWHHHPPSSSCTDVIVYFVLVVITATEEQWAFFARQFIKVCAMFLLLSLSRCIAAASIVPLKITSLLLNMLISR